MDENKDEGGALAFLRKRLMQRTAAGFTLLELLIVMIIMGLLVAISVPAMNSIRKRSLAEKAAENGSSGAGAGGGKAPSSDIPMDSSPGHIDASGGSSMDAIAIYAGIGVLIIGVCVAVYFMTRIKDDEFENELDEQDEEPVVPLEDEIVLEKPQPKPVVPEDVSAFLIEHEASKKHRADQPESPRAKILSKFSDYLKE